MIKLLTALMSTVISSLKSRHDLALENLALRQQLAVLSTERPRPRLTTGARLFWVWLSRVWSDWTSALVIVKPETALRWHLKGFELFWTWRSRWRRLGRAACAGGFATLYTTSAEMLERLHSGQATGGLAVEVSRLTKPAVLVIDEVGLDQPERERGRDGQLMYKAIAPRYSEQRTTIVTSNIRWEDWGSYLWPTMAYDVLRFEEASGVGRGDDRRCRQDPVGRQVRHRTVLGVPALNQRSRGERLQTNRAARDKPLRAIRRSWPAPRALLGNRRCRTPRR
jgi:hypothetical protein